MEIIYIVFLTFVAAAVGTMSGFGTSTIMIPVLAGFFPPVEAILFVSIIHWFGNLWKISLFHGGIDIRLFALFGVTGFATSHLGAFISLGSGETILLRLLGAFLCAYALFVTVQSGFRIPSGRLSALSGGALSGFFAGIFGIGGAIRSLFLSAYDLPKARYIATAGLIGLLVDTTRVITYLAGGATLSGRLWWGLLLFVPVSLLGARAAKVLVGKIPQKRFRLVIAVFLFALGVRLALFS